MFIRIVEIFAAIGAIIHAIIYGSKLYSYLKGRQTQPQQPTSSPRDVVVGVLYSLVCAFLWSVSYVSLSYVSQKVDVLSINVVVLGCASLCFVVLWLITRIYSRLSGSVPKGHATKVDWRSSTPWITAVANLINFVLFIYALYFVSASQVITLGKTNPLFVALLTWLWLKRAPPKSAITAVGLVVLGTVLIMFNENLVIGTRTDTYGSIFAVLAGASFAVFSVGLENIEEQSKPTFSDRVGFLAVAFLLAYVGVITAVYIERRTPTLPHDVELILAANGLRVALVYALYEAAVRRVGALLVSILVAFEVPFTMLLDSRLLHRPPLPRLIFGAIVILFGAITLAIDRSRGIDQHVTS